MMCTILRFDTTLMYLKLFVFVSVFQNYHVTQIVQIEDEQQDDSSKEVNLQDCGLAKRLPKISLRIVGGKKADISEFPWTVTFQKKMSERSAPVHFCGGSVINNRWLLSASHCFQGVKHSLKRVRAVVGSTKWNDSNAVFYEIDKLVMHQKFNSFNYDNDIALIKTKTPIKFKSDANTFHTNSICLSSPSDPMPQNGTIYGWGLLGENSTTSEHLMTTTLRKSNMTMCNQAYKHYIGKMTPHMICYSAPGKDACQGDSGGPLSYFTKGKEYQSGIVSFGLGCARTENPGIYTIVGFYLEWIKKTINEN